MSMAYAGYRFVDRLIDAAFKGVTGVVEPSYVYVAGEQVQSEIGEIDFFSVPVQLGVSRPFPSPLHKLATKLNTPHSPLSFAAQRSREAPPARQAVGLRGWPAQVSRRGAQAVDLQSVNPCLSFAQHFEAPLLTGRLALLQRARPSSPSSEPRARGCEGTSPSCLFWIAPCVLCSPLLSPVTKLKKPVQTADLARGGIRESHVANLDRPPRCTPCASPPLSRKGDQQVPPRTAHLASKKAPGAVASSDTGRVAGRPRRRCRPLT